MSEPARLLLALGLTLVLHLIVVSGVLLASRLPSGREPGAPTTAVAMQTLSADDWERNRALDPDRVASNSPQAPSDRTLEPKPPEEKQVEAPKPPDEDRPAGPVVATAPGNDEIPDDASFAAETNNRVERQTLARDRTSKWKNAQSRTTAEQAREGSGTDEAAQGVQGLPGNGGEGDDERQQQEAGRVRQELEMPAARERQEFAMRPTQQTRPGEGPSIENQPGSEGFDGNSDRLRIQPGREGSGEEGQQGSAGRRGQRGLSALMPSSAVMDRITGAAASDVRDESIEEGDGTFLNTRQWKYASFFNRVKQSVGWAWEPMHQLMRRDPTGSVYGGRDRITVLAVRLDTSGGLQAVEIERSSGLDFLDLEAVRAFEKAQPFPRPPPGMVEDGVIAFNFTFYMDMGGAPRFRFSNPR